MKLLQIPLKEISARFPFSVRYGDDRSLLASVRESGILQPPIVFREKDKYRVACGKRRIQAAKKLRLKTIPAFLIKKKHDKELLLMNLRNDITSGPLHSIVEKALVLRRTARLSFTTAEKKEVFALLKIPFQRTARRVLEKAGRAGKKVKLWLHEKNYPLSFLDFLLVFSQSDIDYLAASVFIPFQTSANETHDLAFSLHDICLRDHIALRELLSQIWNKLPRKMNRREKVNAFSEMVFQMRMPATFSLIQKMESRERYLKAPRFIHLLFNVKDFSLPLTLQARLSSPDDVRRFADWCKDEDVKRGLFSLVDEWRKEREI